MSEALKTLALVNGPVALALGIFYALCAVPAHSADGVSGDGFVAVLSAPFDAAIDTAFSAIGYRSDDDEDD